MLEGRGSRRPKDGRLKRNAGVELHVPTAPSKSILVI
jgi:hypothetical protein